MKGQGPGQPDLLATLGGAIVHDQELGIVTSVQEDGLVQMRLPYRPALTRTSHDGIDEGAITTLLDTVCGVSAMAGLDYRESTATLDLRIDHLAPALPGQDLQATARVTHISGSAARGAVLVAASARTPESQADCARALGRFYRKKLPRPDRAHSLHSDRVLDGFPDYQSLMGFTAQADGAILLPYRVGLIGNGSLPALHGGAIAAHLLESARHLMRDTPTPQVATAQYSFLIYGRPQDLLATAQVEKPGRAVSFVSARAGHPGETTPVATAVFTFVAPPSAGSLDSGLAMR